MSFRLIAVALALLGAASAKTATAQLGLQDVLAHTPQAVLANPATLLDCRLTVQLANYGTSTQLSFSPTDLGTVAGGGLTLSPAAIGSVLPEAPYGRLEIDATTALVNVRRSWGQFGFHHGVRAFADVVAPRTALSLIAEGNRVAIGAPLQVLPEGYFSTWHEVGAHYSRRLGDRMTFGARAKLLLGSSDMRLGAGQRAVLTTAPGTYAIAYDVAAEGFSAGYPIDFGADSLSSPELTFGLGAGYGAAVDFGLVVSPREGLSYGVSVRDVGGIRWTDGRRHGAAATGVYRGAEGNVFDEGFSLTAVASYDSVRRRLSLDTSPRPYGARLPAKLTGHVRTALTDDFEVGAALEAVTSAATTAFNGALRGAYRFCGPGEDGARCLTLGVVAGGGREGLFLGGSITARLGSVLVYASSDQVLGLVRAYGPRSTHGRVGVALVWE